MQQQVYYRKNKKVKKQDLLLQLKHGIGALAVLCILLGFLLEGEDVAQKERIYALCTQDSDISAVIGWLEEESVPAMARGSVLQEPLVPVSGVVTKEFEKNNSPFIEIICKSESIVYSILDGTIIDLFDTEEGYVVKVDYNGGLVGVYAGVKENEQLYLTRTVSRGEAFAITKGTWLRFALYQAEEPIDPLEWMDWGSKKSSKE